MTGTAQGTRIARRDFIGGATALSAAAAIGGAAGAARDRPNFLILLTDDQKWNALGFEGHPLAATPNIDALAARGVAFRNGFVTTPICATSRASILTSTYFARNRFNFDRPGLAPDLVAQSFPKLLRGQGYVTGLVGKLGVWMDDGLIGAVLRRVGLANDHGGMFDSFQPIDLSPAMAVGDDGIARHRIEREEAAALAFLRNRPEGQPFCLVVGFNEPHITDMPSGRGRFEVSPSDARLMPDAVLPPPEDATEAVFAELPSVVRKNELIAGAEAEQWLRAGRGNDYANYFRLIAAVDRVVGNLLSELGRLGLDRNTVVILTSDNGLSLGDHRIFGKWTHLDESIRVPLVIFDPRAGVPGLRPAEFALNVDIAPTILGLAGIEPPAEYQGESLVPFVEGRSPLGWRDEFLIEHRADGGPELPDWVGIRATSFSFAAYDAPQGPEFYLTDLRSDPRETENLADDPLQADRVRALHRRALDWQRALSGTGA